MSPPVSGEGAAFKLHRVHIDALRPVAPLHTTGVAHVHAALAQGRLEVSACTGCGRLAFPPAVICPSCRGSRLAWRTMAPEGRLYSATCIHAAPGRFAAMAPYRLGLVDLDAGDGAAGGGLRIACLLLYPDGATPTLGEAVHLVAAIWRDGPMLAAMQANDRREHIEALGARPRPQLSDPSTSSTSTRKPASIAMIHATPGARASFRALVCDRIDGAHCAEFRELTLDDLPPGEVLVEVAHSALNYKDGLAVTGQAPIARSFPMVAGIDLAGRVVSSSSAQFAPGDRVVVNGRGLAETRWGGYTLLQRLPAEAPIPLPKQFSTLQAMQIGTAGFTAMLCVMAIQSRGVRPGDGAVVVTGAAGGVGSMATALLSRLGYAVVAVTGRPEEAAFLKSLGATDVVGRDEIGSARGALAKPRWAAAVDVAGGEPLAKLIAQMRYDGVVACCGMAAGGEMPATVYPFILRGVTLLGVDSVMVPLERRLEAWRRLANEVDLDTLASLSSLEPLSRIFELAPAILAGRTRGRVAIDVAT